ncbi:orotidine-5'-phosphate decarboxylase [Methanolobus halotolerans]|uniref:Orotidine 5'-phosphate decarboxylase n=1 Tax=Methanolobus halotolerans TaxID=2052935 RepID=A0A4E0Q2I4_9EURY|nr:orotidine-5'-phosphate decarboxylase [Methanolobus halotolerans]TGC11419.1 orotidine-5'-phosphate decarboxylase [Methanolobus halotolerans]
MEKNTRLILALDVLDSDEAIRISKAVAGHVDAIKVGYPLVLASGLQIIEKLVKYAPIIADFKVADIPNTNRLICEQVFDAGADAVIVQGFTGHDSLEACVELARERKKDIFVVTEMSHPGALDLMQEAGKAIAKMAADQCASGVVAPATRPERVKQIRRIIGEELAIISPGVGAQGGSASDAIMAGTDWVIVGRSLYQSADPAGAAAGIVREIKKVIKDSS